MAHQLRCPQNFEGGCEFTTQNGEKHSIDSKWDLIIAHPPCTYLSNACTRGFSLKSTPPQKCVDRWENRAKAAVFFMYFAQANCDKVAVENPVGFMNSAYRKPDQIIHPYMFAESENDKANYVTKRTCLWLRGLPKLQTNDIKAPNLKELNGVWGNGKPKNFTEMVASGDRAKTRSKTFSGIAKAMAEQWGGDIRKEN